MTLSDNPLKVIQTFFSRPNETNLIHLQQPDWHTHTHTPPSSNTELNRCYNLTADVFFFPSLGVYFIIKPKNVSHAKKAAGSIRGRDGDQDQVHREEGSRRHAAWVRYVAFILNFLWTHTPNSTQIWLHLRLHSLWEQQKKEREKICRNVYHSFYGSVRTLCIVTVLVNGRTYLLFTFVSFSSFWNVRQICFVFFN